jgi:YhcH/YjgK/YiaL family protein
MILDNIKNTERYKKTDPKFKAAFDFLENTDLEALEPGRHEIMEDDVFVLIQEYTTYPEEGRLMEAHHKYADIQVVICGEEVIYYAEDSSRMSLDSPYDEQKDCVLYDSKAPETKCILRKGDFAVFYPNEFHMPCCKLSESCEVKKAVVKVKVY